MFCRYDLRLTWQRTTEAVANKGAGYDRWDRPRCVTDFPSPSPMPVSKSLGFLLLLAFSLQLVSQELDGPAAHSVETGARGISGAIASRQSGSHGSSSSPRLEPSKEPASHMADPELLTKAKAMNEREKEKEKEKARESAKAETKEKLSGGTSSSSSSKPSSSSSSSRDPSRSSSSSSSSSRDKEKTISSSAIREAAGSRTVTSPSDSSKEVPYQVRKWWMTRVLRIQLGIGMHYIHAAPGGRLNPRPNTIPSEGMAHPLLTTTWSSYAN